MIKPLKVSSIVQCIVWRKYNFHCLVMIIQNFHMFEDKLNIVHIPQHLKDEPKYLDVQRL